ncbi:MAG: hypothetical protein Q4P36_06235 [Bowdeniella nasicola]|nr:hypothetical protein [Bowdeniella nasicola]
MLKRLAAEALPVLVRESDPKVIEKLMEVAKRQIGDEAGRVRAKDLVELLLQEGTAPRDYMVSQSVNAVERNSAQSAARVSEFASALGVESNDLRKRIAPTGSSKSTRSLLERAFAARNEIAHELDVTKPAEAARQKLEHFRRYRKLDDITKLCCELLDVTQCLVNDVVARMPDRSPTTLEDRL